MIRVLLTEVTPGAAEGIRALLAVREEVEVVGYPRDGLEAAQMAVRLRPDVLLLHDQLPEMPGTLACELTTLAAPEVAVALMCERSDPATLKRAMRAGARCVVTPNTTPDELAATLRDLATVKERRQEPEYALAVDPAAMPITVAVVSARDGVGKSTLVANLGSALAQRYPNQVVIVDLCGQFGSIALLLNIRPAHTIVDLASFASDMDGELIETFLEQHPSGVRVLAGGVRPDPAWTDALSVGFVSSVLSLLRRRYRYVVCDVPSVMWPGSLYAMTRAQHCLLVTSLCEATGLREVAALADTLAPAHVPAERLHLVVNKPTPQEWFSEDELKAAVRREPWHSLPHDPAAVAAAAREGQTVVNLKPAAAYAKSVTALADKLVANGTGS